MESNAIFRLIIESVWYFKVATQANKAAIAAIAIAKLPNLHSH